MWIGKQGPAILRTHEAGHHSHWVSWRIVQPEVEEVAWVLKVHREDHDEQQREQEHCDGACVAAISW